jgi:primase/DNA polymerase family protein/AAA domain-containing protein
MSALPTAIQTLTRLDQWVAWRYAIDNKGKPTKVPYQARPDDRGHHAKADPTDPDTWAPHAAAEAVAAHFDGIGFMVTKGPYCGIDLDHCINPETGQVAPWAQAVVDRFHSYTEATPSGAGLRVWIEGALPAHTPRKFEQPDDGCVEIYDRNSPRYFTVTGLQWGGCSETIEPRQAELDAWHVELVAAKAAAARPRPDTPPVSNGPPPGLDDAVLLEKAARAKNGVAFARLWAGDWATTYGSQSEADFALCGYLAFWTGPDAAQLDRLFRQSGLMRTKWDTGRGGDTYGSRTIAKVLAAPRATYDPSRNGAGPAAGPTEDSDPTRPEIGARGAGPSDYIETLTAFLAEDDPPRAVIFPDLLPAGVITLWHGEPRARKSLAAFELALAAATGTAPFGLTRFAPADAINVLYIQEEDPRGLTKVRLRRLVAERCGATPPTMHVSVRQGIDLDDPTWVERLIGDLQRLDIMLLVLDAARRFSAKTDEGPAKVRELMAVLRAIVTQARVTLVIVHHDIKPPTAGQDLRRRGQRASGGDWFAGSECPVHVERLSATQTLVYPQDYKFAADPAPFTFTCLLDGPLVRQVLGQNTTTDLAETAGERGKLLDWLRLNGPASKTGMKKAGFGWATLGALLDGLLRDGLIDTTPGRKKGSALYFVPPSEPSSTSQDGSQAGGTNAR